MPDNGKGSILEQRKAMVDEAMAKIDAGDLGVLGLDPAGVEMLLAASRATGNRGNLDVSNAFRRQLEKVVAEQLMKQVDLVGNTNQLQFVGTPVVTSSSGPVATTTPTSKPTSESGSQLGIEKILKALFL